MKKEINELKKEVINMNLNRDVLVEILNKLDKVLKNKDEELLCRVKREVKKEKLRKMIKV